MALLVLAALCVLRLQAVLVQVVQVLAQVGQAVVLRSVEVVLVVQVVQVLVQEHVRVVRAQAAQVVQVAVVQVAQVAVNVALLKRNHVHVVVKTSMKCCRKPLRVTQQAMHRCQKASSLSSADHRRKSLLLN